MRIKLFILMILASWALAAQPSTEPVEIFVKPVKGDATVSLRKAIDKAHAFSGRRPVVISLQPGAVYDLSRDAATPLLYHVSNTTSVTENPSPVKHIGMLLKNMTDVVIDGRGATLRTHGEMTPWVIDGCRNVELRNFTVEAADPTVTEMTVETVDSMSFTARVHPASHYAIRDGKLYWQGEGWEFTDGIAQIYDPVTQITHRCPSPIVNASAVSELSPGLLRFDFNRPIDTKPGLTYQMRHSLRTEVAGLINCSEDVTLSDLTLRFMGNFGIVAQTSADLTYRRLNCEPDSASGRTCAGFADFLQVSGCRGLVDIADCRFSGSHDDPINIHGTHLRVTDWGDRRHITLTYMHPQTFGFQSFFPGDSVEIVDPASLLPVASAVVTEAEMTDDYNVNLTLDCELSTSVCAVPDAVVENITWTPEVRITGCRFRATPTRGILVTTRRPVLIADNIFERTPMAAILIADDARSWYESGPVKDLTIRDNLFIDCSLPVINIAPEISRYDGPVHSNISVTGNRFEFTTPRRGSLIFMRAADSVAISGNHLISPSYMPFTHTLESTTNTTISSDDPAALDSTASAIFTRIQPSDSTVKSIALREMFVSLPDTSSVSAMTDIVRSRLYEPDSPQADDETFLVAADLLLADNRLTDSDRARLEYMKETAMLNRVDHRAADFEIKTISGVHVKLSDLVGRKPLTVLMFYDPDCEDCAALEERLMHALRPDVAVVMVSPYGEQDGLWARHAATMPDTWTVGLPVDEDFEDSGLYDIRSTPAVLMLDSDMIVKTKKISDLLSSDGIVAD